MSSLSNINGVGSCHGSSLSLSLLSESTGAEMAHITLLVGVVVVGVVVARGVCLRCLRGVSFVNFLCIC